MNQSFLPMLGVSLCAMPSSESIILTEKIPMGSWKTITVPSDTTWKICAYGPCDIAHFGADDGGNKAPIKLCSSDPLETTSNFSSRPRFDDITQPSLQNTDQHQEQLGYLSGEEL